MEAIPLDNSQPLYLQVVHVLEQQIYEGKLQPGDQLPTTLDLCRQFSLAKNTIQQALKILVDRGMVERTTGRGTFVSKHVNAKAIAIVSGLNYYHSEHGHYHQRLCYEFKMKAESKGWRSKFYLPEIEYEFDRMFHELERDILSGLIRAIFVVCINPEIEYWLKSHCKVPYYTSSNREREERNIDDHQISRGLNYLLERSFKSIAILNCSQQFNLIHQYIDNALKHSHSKDAKIDDYSDYHISESTGYQLVKEVIFKDHKTYDALLVCNDIMCKGVLFGLMELGFKIPADIAILTHSNKGMEILSPVPLTRIEMDPSGLASYSFGYLMDKIKGIKTMALPDPPQLIVGKSCGE